MTRTTVLIGSSILLLLAACSGKSPADPSEDGQDGGSQQNAGDAAVMPDSGNPYKVGDGDGSVAMGNDAATTCLSACADDDCGKVPTGCGSFLDCGSCSDGLVCSATTPNKCGTPPPDPCTARSAQELCAGKCGAVSDGCSGIVYCGADNGGEVCASTQQCVDSVCKQTTPDCVPETCAQKGLTCGVDGDGCGGTLSCGGCADGQQCVYSTSGSQCETVAPVTCTPLTAAQACTGTCGVVGDGCGGQIHCEDAPETACPSGTTCGGGGEPGVCGSGQTCAKLPVTTACAGKCGSQSDGCDGTYACDNENGGQTCDTAGGESCGGGGVPNQCGKPACVPRSQTEACPGGSSGKSCGMQADGCDGLIDCGGCPQDQMCGLYESSVCGAPPACQPMSAATLCAGKCGAVQEPNCGGLYQCTSENGGVTCTGQETCGATTPNVCGTPESSCVPKTCNELGHSCGLASDGCGNVLNCWPDCSGSLSCTGSCSSSATCLADPGTGAQSCVSGTPACSGSLCGSVSNTCPGNSPTTLTGTVLTPGRYNGSTYLDQLPVPNAVVYIPADPNVPLPDILEGVSSTDPASCGRCSDDALVADGETLLAAAVTDFKGQFVLQGRIPVGTAFKLVVKVGKWRTVWQVTADVVSRCESRALPLEVTKLAGKSTDGLTGTHLPKVAVSTGDVDAMECVLRGIGIDDSEFTVPSGTGRVHMYRANGTRMSGTTCTGTYRSGWFNVSCANNNNEGCLTGRSGCAWSDASVSDKTLYASEAAINAYDMVVFDCEGTSHYIRTSTERNRLLNYTNIGGRVFASHWSYEWLDNTGSLDSASAWTNTGADNTATGYVSLPSGATARTGANPVKSLVYNNWLDWQGALTGTTAGTLSHPDVPQMSLTDPRDVAGSSVGPSTDEWMYRNVTSNNSTVAKVQQLSFNTPYGAAEDAICGRVAFSAFHVAATSGGTTLSTKDLRFPAECHSGALTPQEKTLAFMLFDLGACVSAGDPPQPPSCTPDTVDDLCPDINDACGYVSDGCGDVVDCGSCGPGYYCDGDLCRPQQCTPFSCTSLGYNCGSWDDGCGGIARNSQGTEGCGECTGGQICGLTSPGICGGCVKIAQSVACPDNACGAVSDGCGGVYNCGICTSGYCGGGGPNVCGPANCTPLSQATACGSKNCGLVADGCGGTLNCGVCTDPADTCGGAGVPNVCGHPTCTPKSQAQACTGFNCGWVSDGCGGAINCGTCINGGVCGGGGPNVCGGSCTPTTCDAANAECGTIGNLCGGLINCGPCPTGQTCGASSPNQCGSGPSCTPRTCQQAGATCGLIGDGCGAALDCGTCSGQQTCGGAGVPNQCGTGTSGCNKRTCAAQNVQCGAASDGCGGLLDCGGCSSGSYCQNGQCVPALL